MKSKIAQLSDSTGIPEIVLTQVLAELTAGSFLEQVDLKHHLIQECMARFPDICIEGKLAKAA